MRCFVRVPLNANELKIPGTKGRPSRVCVVSSSNNLTQTSPKMSETVLPFMFKLESDSDGETQEEVTECNRTFLNG